VTVTITRIKRAFSGEKFVDTVPSVAAFVDDTELRRLRFFPGRHLTQSALELEQTVRTRRLTLRARALRAGVLSGLEASIVFEGGRSQLRVTSGRALAENGEDITLDRALTVPVSDILLLPPGAGAPPLLVSDLPSGSGVSSVGVLLLQPGYCLDQEVPLAAKAVELRDHEFQPFERHLGDEAFHRHTLLDAARLVYCPWPSELELPASSAQWRNEIAWSIFDNERASAPHPWLAHGVPVALLALDGSHVPIFLDRHAVVRRGGRVRGHGMRTGQSDPELLRARIDQLAAELFERQAVTAASQLCRYLPPFGVLPKPYVAWREAAARDATTHKRYRTVTDAFFPASYRVRLAVAPLEELDVIAARSQALAPYDLQQPDRVILLAVVPQSAFDPQLLQIEEIPEDFRNAVQQLLQTRATVRARRDDLRSRRRVLASKIEGPDALPADAATDPGQLDLDEQPDTSFVPAAKDAFDTTGTAPNYQAVDFAALRSELLRTYDTFKDDPEQPGLATYYEKQRAIKLGELAELDKGVRPFVRLISRKLADADELLDSHFLTARTDVYRLGQLLSGNTLATRFAASDALASLVQRQVEPSAPDKVNAFASQLIGAAAATTAGATPFLQTIGTQPAVAAPLAAPLVGIDLDRLDRKLGVPIELIREGNEIKGAKIDSVFVQEEVKEALLSNRNLLGALQLEQGFGVLPIKEISELKLDQLKPPESKGIGEKITTTRNEIFNKLQLLDICLLGLGTEFISDGQPRKLRFAEVLLQNPQIASDKPTEAEHFAYGVRHADLTINALRAIRARIRTYRELLDRCARALANLEQSRQALEARLHEVENVLSEARHDVAVARALEAEETARVTAVNVARERVLRELVPFFVFHRPRAIDPRADVPAHALYPALREAPVPAALRENLPVPADLEAFESVFREAPARYFRFAPAWLERIDRLEHMRDLVRLAIEHAAGPVRPVKALTGGRYTGALANLLTARTGAAEQQRKSLAALSVSWVGTAAYQELRGHAHERLTLGHYIEHGPGALARNAAQELDAMFRVATALHRDFSRAPSLLRLLWAETFSQHDTPPSLRDLSTLPRFQEVEFTQRREMQLLVDWLYGRVYATLDDARELIDELVRVCLLLASHAPVDQLLGGTLVEPVHPTPGALVKLRVDAQRVRVGMGVVIEAAAGKLVRAVVDDVGDDHALARVTTTSTITGPLPANTFVRFLERNERY
jgi:hypothetical protein